MGVFDINQARERRNTRLQLLRDFNVAGNPGMKSWKEFIQLAKQTGFTETDFHNRLGADLILMRLWQNGYAIPPEWRRREFKKAIVGTLYDRFGFPPAFEFKT